VIGIGRPIVRRTGKQAKLAQGRSRNQPKPADTSRFAKLAQQALRPWHLRPKSKSGMRMTPAAHLPPIMKGFLQPPAIAAIAP